MFNDWRMCVSCNTVACAHYTEMWWSSRLVFQLGNMWRFFSSGADWVADSPGEGAVRYMIYCRYNLDRSCIYVIVHGCSISIPQWVRILMVHVVWSCRVDTGQSCRSHSKLYCIVLEFAFIYNLFQIDVRMCRTVFLVATKGRPFSPGPILSCRPLSLTNGSSYSTLLRLIVCGWLCGTMCNYV